VVQSLSLDTKLHTLFDKMCHKGKNVMDYKVPQLDSSLEADTALSDMLVSEEEDVNNSYSDQDEADCSCDAEIEENESGDNDDTMEDNNDPDWEDNHDTKYDVEYIEENDDNNINMEAYDTEDTNESGLQKEQTGQSHAPCLWMDPVRTP